MSSGLQHPRQKIALFKPKFEISKWYQDGFINKAQILKARSLYIKKYINFDPRTNHKKKKGGLTPEYPQCDHPFVILRYVDTRKCYIKHIWWGICLRSLGET